VRHAATGEELIERRHWAFPRANPALVGNLRE
jgi:hypothetical protein